MKAPIRVLTPLVLCAILIAGSVFISRGEAKSGNPVQTSTIPAVASNVAGPVRPEWRLGSPHKHNNLTVFPVLADAPTTGSDHITLDDVLEYAAGAVVRKTLRIANREEPKKKPVDSPDVVDYVTHRIGSGRRQLR